MIGAVLLAAPLAAQQTDTLPKRVPPVPLAIEGDTTFSGKPAADTVPKDTVKAPIAVSFRPIGPEIRGRRRMGVVAVLGESIEDARAKARAAAGAVTVEC